MGQNEKSVDKQRALSQRAVPLSVAPLVQRKRPRLWRQAMIAPKADAGFFLMAAKARFAEQEGFQDRRSSR